MMGAFVIKQQKETSRGTPCCRWCSKPIRPRGVWKSGHFHSNACAIAFAEWVMGQINEDGAVTIKNGGER